MPLRHSSFDPPILLRKSAYMQRIADHARGGYTRFTAGTVPVERTAALARKFRDLYLVDMSKHRRYRRKREGLGNAYLLFWIGEHGAAGPLHFVLQVTAEGDHPARSLERLRDATKERLEVTGYELVRVPRRPRGQSARGCAPVNITGPTSGVLSWTWRISSDGYQRARDRVRQAVRAPDDLRLRQVWNSLHRSPGFGPVRDQVKKLLALVAAEWQRVKRGPLPVPARFVRYIDRRPSLALPLSAVIRESRRLESAAWTSTDADVGDVLLPTSDIPLS